MADVETNTKDDSIHHVWNFPLLVCLRVGFWCQCIWFGFWGRNWFYRTTNQEQLCGFWKHVSLSGFFPLIIILINASLSSNTYNNASWWEELTFEEMKSTLSKSLITPWDCFRCWIVWGVERTTFVYGSPRSWLLWYVFPWRTATIRSHKSSAENTIQPQSCIQRNDFWFCWTLRNWSLFLTHTTTWNKCMTSKNAQCSTWRRFWILFLCKIGVLKTVRICMVLQCFPHSNTVCHMYDECKRSNERIVCHMLWSILWSIVQVCSLTIEYRVFQYAPSLSISCAEMGHVIQTAKCPSRILVLSRSRSARQLSRLRSVAGVCTSN